MAGIGAQFEGRVAPVGPAPRTAADAELGGDYYSCRPRYAGVPLTVTAPSHMHSLLTVRLPVRRVVERASCQQHLQSSVKGYAGQSCVTSPASVALLLIYARAVDLLAESAHELA